MGLYASGVRRLAGAACVLTLAGTASVLAQRGTATADVLPSALEAMVDTERAFAQRALEVGW